MHSCRIPVGTRVFVMYECFKRKNKSTGIKDQINSYTLNNLDLVVFVMFS